MEQPEHEQKKTARQGADEAAHGRARAAVAIVAAILVILVAALLLLSDWEREPEAEQIQTGQDGVVRLAFVGDIRMSQAMLEQAQNDGTYDFSDSFFGVAGVLEDADLTIGNLECSLTASPQGDNWAPDSFPQTLAGLGFDVLQTANSYSILGGVEGLRHNMQQLRAAGIEPVGTSEDETEYENSRGVVIKQVNGVRIAFVSFTKGLNNMSLPQQMGYAVNLLYTDYDTNYTKVDTESIDEVMQFAREQEPDVIVALVHWGAEDDGAISDTQRQIAQRLLDDGATAVVGAHSHLLGPLRQIKVTDGATERNTVVAYGLGDFFSDTQKSGEQQSIVLQLEFRRGSQDAVELTSVDYEPVYKIVSEDGCRVWQTSLASQLYEQDYLYHVSDEDYEAIQQAQEQIRQSLFPEETGEESEDGD